MYDLAWKHIDTRDICGPIRKEHLLQTHDKEIFYPPKNWNGNITPGIQIKFSAVETIAMIIFNRILSCE